MSKVLGQKDFSIFMILAMAQSFFWLFILPDICKPLWPLVFGNIQSHYIKEVVLNHTVTLVFIIYSLLILPVYYLQLPFFEQFKTNRDKAWPWLDDDIQKRHQFWKLVKKSLQLFTFNLIFIVTFLTVINRRFMEYMGIQGPSFDLDKWPSKMEMIRHNAICTLMHEFLFHTSHRIMHMYPSLYKYHKVHHEYKSLVYISAQHNHPVDYILSLGIPVLVSLTLTGPHSFTQAQWAIYLMYTNLDDHVGYSFPFSPVRWFPFAACTQEHEFHHSVNNGCFSSKLDIFENLFKTNRRYLIWEEKRIANNLKRI